MTDRAAFVAAIEADPDSDLPRLVWADWLEEHGEPERAELIRVQCELAHNPSPKLRGRERAILNALGRAWPAELSAGLDFNGSNRQFSLRHRFRRGCLWALSFYTDPQQGTPVRAMAPFVGREPLLGTCLVINTKSGRGVADNPLLRRVVLVSSSGPALASPHLTSVRWLLGCRLDGLQVLRTAPVGSRLEVLLVDTFVLPWHPPVPAMEVAELLAHNPRLSNLSRLNINCGPFGTDAVRVLLASPHLAPTLVLELPPGARPRPGSILGRQLRDRFPGPPSGG